ncbi:uncharacterized protein N7496_012166 [Penicillium cataractarum]|uniref:Uncharacterized protein n=1 Tax=Penicillium cataractarum TaxID=2100454 RepID=A0A9W9UW54_9EURO|nr:uncharacterized protein N7496_012166 [Penicillium cataractarum]KAJ5359753.1 hypothetical protein N7496_012166 [Penicillium cataractarum]
MILSLVTMGLSTPLVFRSDSDGPPINATFIQCTEGTADPICQLLRRPDPDIVTEITHPNGAIEVKRNLYTREQLQAVRKQNNVTSVEYKPGDAARNQSTEFISSLTKREPAPPTC